MTYTSSSTKMFTLLGLVGLLACLILISMTTEASVTRAVSGLYKGKDSRTWNKARLQAADELLQEGMIGFGDRSLLTALLEEDGLFVADNGLTEEELESMKHKVKTNSTLLLPTLKKLHEIKYGPIRNQTINTHRRFDNGVLEEFTDMVQVHPTLYKTDIATISAGLIAASEHHEMHANEDTLATIANYERLFNDIESGLEMYSLEVDVMMDAAADYHVNDFDLKFLFDAEYAFLGDFKDCVVNNNATRTRALNHTSTKARKFQALRPEILLSPKNVKAVLNSEDLAFNNEQLSEEYSLPFSNTMNVNGLKIKPGQRVNIKCYTTTLVKSTGPANTRFESTALMALETQVMSDDGSIMNLVSQSDFKKSFSPYKWYFIGAGMAIVLVALAIVGYFTAKLIKSSKSEGKSATQHDDLTLSRPLPEEQQPFLAKEDLTIV